MILKHGKFYQDGSEVPPEFGNREQIRLLDAVKPGKQAERFVKLAGLSVFDCPGCNDMIRVTKPGEASCTCGLKFLFDGEILKII